MQGLNINVTIFERVQGADDVYGGAQASHAIRSTGRGRLMPRQPTIAMRAQGLSTDRLFDGFIAPTMEAVTGDLLRAETGPYAAVLFLVEGVHLTPLANRASPRAYTKLQLRRWDDGKVVDNLWA